MNKGDVEGIGIAIVLPLCGDSSMSRQCLGQDNFRYAYYLPLSRDTVMGACGIHGGRHHASGNCLQVEG